MDRLALRLAAGCSVAALTFSGCGSGESPVEKAPRRAVAIAAAETTQPLTEEDVDNFLALVEQLPKKAVPGFQTAAARRHPDGLNGRQLAAAYQREFEDAYRPAVQARRWQRNHDLTDALEEAQVDPEAMASLLVRLSSAVAREALDDRVDLKTLEKRTEAAIRRLCDQYDDLPKGDPGQLSSVDKTRRERIIAAIQEAVAFRQFTHLLANVPQESLDVVTARREELASYLPVGETVAAFEKRSESAAMILQASHEEPAAPRARKKPRPQ
jgi:hypothetical protein